MIPGILAPVVVVLALAAAGCASSGAVPKPFPGAPVTSGTEASGADAAETALTRGVVHTALTFRGVPYRNGGSDPSGFDCSGLVQYVFAQHGVGLPREVREQFRLGEDVDRDRVQPGDLVFFSTAGRSASHVGVAIGGDEFVHAPSSRGVVRVDRFSAPYWSARLVGVRRLR